MRDELAQEQQTREEEDCHLLDTMLETQRILQRILLENFGTTTHLNSDSNATRFFSSSASSEDGRFSTTSSLLSSSFPAPVNSSSQVADIPPDADRVAFDVEEEDGWDGESLVLSSHHSHND